jgi:hypothetical protein
LAKVQRYGHVDGLEFIVTFPRPILSSHSHGWVYLTSLFTY